MVDGRGLPAIYVFIPKIAGTILSVWYANDYRFAFYLNRMQHFVVPLWKVITKTKQGGCLAIAKFYLGTLSFSYCYIKGKSELNHFSKSNKACSELNYSLEKSSGGK